MKGQHKPGYHRPRTGEKRQVRQPLAIDKLPEAVRMQIQKRRAAGQTWEEISEASAEFAGKPLAVTTLHRWYDLRIEQVRREVMAQAERAREVAAAFAGKGFEKLPEAVQAGLSTAIFALAESQDEASRNKFLKAMSEFSWLLARHRQLDQEDRRLALESKKLETLSLKIRGLKDAVAKKKMNPQDLAKKLDEIYDIARPKN